MPRTAATYVNPTHYNVAAKFTTAVSSEQTYGLTTGKGSPCSCASGSPVSGAGVEISASDYAAEIIIVADQDIFLSEDQNFRHYTRCYAEKSYLFGMGEMDGLYVAAVDANATVYWYFNNIS
jgi:hypothetical protein